MNKARKEPLYAVVVFEDGVVEDVALVRGAQGARKARDVLEALSGGQVAAVRVTGARQLAGEYEEAK